MNRRNKMFFRMITASLIRRRSRMLVALLAIAVGATVLSGLVTIYYDVPRQMGAQFRNYGANMIFLPASAEIAFDRETAEQAAAVIKTEELVGMVPYRYTTVGIREQPVVAAGTDWTGARATSPYWRIAGEWPENAGELLAGQTVADTLGLEIGDKIYLTASQESGETPEKANASDAGYPMTVTGVLDTGGSEEEYIYISLEDMEELAGAGELDAAELSVSATRERLNAYAEEVTEQVPGVTARLVKRVTQSESAVLTKLQALVLLVTVVVLALTMICVATTMTAVVAERRKEIGLRKALGASDREIIGEFMGEGLLLGVAGGVLGSVLGFAFAQMVSARVFAASIRFQPLLLPATVAVSVIVTGFACLFPVRGATKIDPALVLKGE